MDARRTSFAVCSLLLAVACSSGKPAHVIPGTAGTGATGAAGTNGAAGETASGTAGGGPAGSTAQGGNGGDATGDAGSAGGSTASGSGGSTDTGAGGTALDAGQATSGDGGSTGAAGTNSGAPDSGFAVGDFSKAMPIGDQTLPRKIYILNSCSYDIWTFTQLKPGNTFPNNNAPLMIAAGELQVVGASSGLTGRIWPRSECTGTGNNVKCAQTGNDTLAEFTLNAGKKSDWYDISLVDGFTIPLSIIQLDAPWTADPSYVPGGKLGADGQCGSPVCAVDLDKNCPASQQKKDSMGNVVECENGQSSNGGQGSTPVTLYMKMGCPTSYTYPYDDPQSLFTCPCVEQNGGVGAKDYEIVYCPAPGMNGFP